MVFRNPTYPLLSLKLCLWPLRPPSYPRPMRYRLQPLNSARRCCVWCKSTCIMSITRELLVYKNIDSLGVARWIDMLGRWSGECMRIIDELMIMHKYECACLHCPTWTHRHRKSSGRKCLRKSRYLFPHCNRYNPLAPHLPRQLCLQTLQQPQHVDFDAMPAVVAPNITAPAGDSASAPVPAGAAVAHRDTNVVVPEVLVRGALDTV